MRGMGVGATGAAVRRVSGMPAAVPAIATGRTVAPARGTIAAAGRAGTATRGTMAAAGRAVAAARGTIAAARGTMAATGRTPVTPTGLRDAANHNERDSHARAENSKRTFHYVFPLENR